MSTGLDCYFEEKAHGEWYLYLEESYGSKPGIDYEEFGPFPTFAAAMQYLRDNFANPGGFSVHALPDTKDQTLTKARSSDFAQEIA